MSDCAGTLHMWFMKYCSLTVRITLGLCPRSRRWRQASSYGPQKITAHSMTRSGLAAGLGQVSRLVMDRGTESGSDIELHRISK